MPPPAIRTARADEYDEIARVWMNSWASTGLEDASNFLLAKLRARVPLEMERGWTLYVADDRGTIAAMLALDLPRMYLDQLFVAPEYQGQTLGRKLLAFTRELLPREIHLRCVRENEKAWRWYEREGFVFELCHEILSVEEGGARRAKHSRVGLSGLQIPWTRSNFNFAQDPAPNSQRRFDDVPPLWSVSCFGLTPSL